MASYVRIRLLFARLDSFHLCQATVGILSFGFFLNSWLDWLQRKQFDRIGQEIYSLVTTPFFSMMRYVEFCLGARLAFDQNPRKLVEASQEAAGRHLTAQSLLTTVVSIVLEQFCLLSQEPR